MTASDLTPDGLRAAADRWAAALDDDAKVGRWPESPLIAAARGPLQHVPDLLRTIADEHRPMTWWIKPSCMKCSEHTRGGEAASYPCPSVRAFVAWVESAP